MEEENSTTGSWYNYKTGKYDILTDTPSDFSEYIPQIPAAQNMYSALIMMGCVPIDAAIKVLHSVAGDPSILGA